MFSANMTLILILRKEQHVFRIVAIRGCWLFPTLVYRRRATRGIHLILPTLQWCHFHRFLIPESSSDEKRRLLTPLPSSGHPSCRGNGFSGSGYCKFSSPLPSPNLPKTVLEASRGQSVMFQRAFWTPARYCPKEILRTHFLVPLAPFCVGLPGLMLSVDTPCDCPSCS